MAVFLFLIIENFPTKGMLQFWRQYNWVGVQHFDKLKVVSNV